MISARGFNGPDINSAQVLALCYTAHDLAPFARDLSRVNAEGSVKPPFFWKYEDRRQGLAALDVLAQLRAISSWTLRVMPARVAAAQTIISMG